MKALFLKFRTQLLVAAIVALVLIPQAFTFASTTITINTDVLFSAVNDWIATFLGPLSIGIGIAIALALIGFVGGKIVEAFRGAR